MQSGRVSTAALRPSAGVGRLDDLVPRGLQRLAQHRARHPRVVDDQNARHGLPAFSRPLARRRAAIAVPSARKLRYGSTAGPRGRSARGRLRLSGESKSDDPSLLAPRDGPAVVGREPLLGTGWRSRSPPPRCWSSAASCPPRRSPRSARRRASTSKRIEEIEREVQHDVIAFVSCVAESVGPEGRWLHYGLTSSDVVDTALAMCMRDACDLIRADLRRPDRGRARARASATSTRR